MKLKVLFPFLILTGFSLSLSGQTAELDSIRKYNTAMKQGVLKQSLLLFEDGVQTENLNMESHFFADSTHIQAWPVEIFSTPAFRLVLEHQAGVAYLMPGEAGKQPFDTLLTKELIDSTGQRTKTESGVYSILVRLKNSNGSGQHITLLYDDAYRILGYDLISQTAEKKTRIHCEITHIPGQKSEWGLDKVLSREKQPYRLLGKAKEYQFYNMIQE